MHNEDVEEPTLFLTLEEDKKCEDSTWYLDNEASNHMTGDRSKFVEFDTKVTGHVRFGDESKVEIKGKGIILFELKNGSHKILPNTYYIPKTKNNILSIWQLMENGCKIVIENRYLWYLTCTRPDILFLVGLISRYMENPSETHRKVAKRILCYLKGTLEYGMFYLASDEFELKGYCDSDYVGDIDNRKSITRFVFFLGNSWKLKYAEILLIH